MIRNIYLGIGAGLVATLVLSVLMLSKSVVPQLDTVTLLDGIARSLLARTEMGWHHLAGWLWHFIIGTLWWGSMFGLLEPILPGRRYWIRGAYFGLGAGLLVLWSVLPLAGAGMFGMHLNPLQPLITLIEHIVYGVVLGTVYGYLISSRSFPQAGR
jgi:hypothetical protein